MPYRHNRLAITNIHTMSKIYISDDIGQKQCGMEYYLTIKKEQNNAVWSNTDGPRGYHTE